MLNLIWKTPVSEKINEFRKNVMVKSISDDLIRFLLPLEFLWKEAGQTWEQRCKRRNYYYIDDKNIHEGEACFRSVKMEIAKCINNLLGVLFRRLINSPRDNPLRAKWNARQLFKQQTKLIIPSFPNRWALAKLKNLWLNFRTNITYFQAFLC